MPAVVVPPKPVVVDRVLDDPELVWRLAETNGPYTHVLMLPEFAKGLETYKKATSGPMANLGTMVGDDFFTAPVFRGNWAYDRPLIDGVEPLLHNDRFAAAARQVFDAEVVRPQIVYINFTAPMGQNQKHLDVPAFRGVDRTVYPAWVTGAMMASGLFERYRVLLATGVAWYYEGIDGGFSYWPDGADGEAITIKPPSNMAVVGDNELMFHRVEAIGESRQHMTMPIDALLTFDPGGGQWHITKGDRSFGTFGRNEIRISVSWKAQVFRTAHDAEVFDGHLDDVTFDEVMEQWRADLAGRGVILPPSDDPVHDPAISAAVTTAYRSI